MRCEPHLYFIEGKATRVGASERGKRTNAKAKVENADPLSPITARQES
jgi:hypothetical protein